MYMYILYYIILYYNPILGSLINVPFKSVCDTWHAGIGDHKQGVSSTGFTLGKQSSLLRNSGKLTSTDTTEVHLNLSTRSSVK